MIDNLKNKRIENDSNGKKKMKKKKKRGKGKRENDTKTMVLVLENLYFIYYVHSVSFYLFIS